MSGKFQETIFTRKINTKELPPEIREELDLGETVGNSVGIVGGVNNYVQNAGILANKTGGHGLFAERANHLHDSLTGEDAQLVGGNNAKNGADRVVNGQLIQDKFLATATRSINSAFSEGGTGNYRYLDSQGNPMQLEVPKDQYEQVVKKMEEKIRAGKVPNVNDPEKAKDIVRESPYTYQQVKNIAKAGTVESLTYDAANGVRLAGSAMGISATVTLALSLWNGEDFEEALKNACLVGIKTGGLAWVGSILSAQIGRTGIESSLRGATDWAVKAMGKDITQLLARMSGKTIYGAAANNYVSKLLRGNVVTGLITTTVLTVPDITRMFQGKMSGAQLFKNFAKTGAGVAGGAAGWMGGAALGSFILPGIGTAVGGVLGGIAGSLGLGSVATNVADGVLSSFIKEDAEEMLAIVEDAFIDVTQDYFLNEEEAKSLIDRFKSKLGDDMIEFLQNMYAKECYSDRKEMAHNSLLPIVDNIVSQRKHIGLPQENEILETAAEILSQAA